jgi:hypothetical protein
MPLPSSYGCSICFVSWRFLRTSLWSFGVTISVLWGCLDCSHHSPNQIFGRWLPSPASFGSVPKDGNHANFLVLPFWFYARTLVRCWRQNRSPKFWLTKIGGAVRGAIQTGPIYLLWNLVFYAQTKYIEVNYHSVREHVVQKLLQIKFMTSYALSQTG